MIAPNADITIYHKSYDPARREYLYTPTQYAGVHWYGGQGATIQAGGLRAADGYVVRILADNEIDAGVDDIVVRALTSEPVTAAAPLLEQYKGQCFVVVAVRDNRRGVPALHHWRLEGK